MPYHHYQGDCPHLQSYLELGGNYHSMCAHTLFALYFLLSPHDLEKLRVIKEYFVGKVMLGFIGSNSNMTLYGYLNLPSNTSCTSPNSKKAFLTALSETVVGNNIATKTAFGKFFLGRSLPP